MNIKVGAKSDVGQVRKANEDSFLVQDPVFVVADGMGGHTAGDVASATAVKLIADGAKGSTHLEPQELAEMVRRANAAIWDKASADSSLHGMGTTCTLLMLDGGKAHIAHVGDSRAYLLRGGNLKQITDDHSLVGRLVREGKLTPEQAERHPQRSIITRALGVDADVEVDLLSVDLQDGDRLMMCSDGLSSMTNDASIEQVLTSESDPQTAADRLVDLANEAGGEDNVTVVVIDIGANGQVSTARRGDTAQIATPPRRGDTREAPSPETPAARGATSPRRRGRLLAAVLILLLLGGVAYAGTTAYLGSQWFVGLNNEGFVTVFKGRPEQILGWSLRTTVRETDLHVAELPESFQENVQTGITEGSEGEANERVRALEQRAEERRPPDPLGEDPSPTPQPTPSPTRRESASNNTTNDKKDQKGAD